MASFQLLLTAAVEKSQRSQTDVAEQAGISVQHLHNCMTGVRAPTRDLAEDLARIFRLDGQELDEFIAAARMAKAMRRNEFADDLRELREKLDRAQEIFSGLAQFFESRGIKLPNELAKKLHAFKDE